MPCLMSVGSLLYLYDHIGQHNVKTETLALSHACLKKILHKPRKLPRTSEEGHAGASCNEHWLSAPLCMTSKYSVYNVKLLLQRMGLYFCLCSCRMTVHETSPFLLLFAST